MIPGALPALAAILLCAALAWPGVSAGAEINFGYHGQFGDTGRGRRELDRPRGMDKSEKGLLAVADAGRNTVVLFDGRGNWLRSLGSPLGTGPVSFKEPTAVVFDAVGRLWVVDTGHDRVVAVNPNGIQILKVGGRGIRKGEFRHPVDITFGEGKKLFVADQGNRRVQIFDTDGDFIEEWRDKSPDGGGPVKAPSRLAYTSSRDGYLWLVNEGSTKVLKLDMEGRQVDAVDVAASVEGEVRIVAIKAEGPFDRLFVCDGAFPRVIVFGGGRYLNRFNLEPGSVPTGLAKAWNGDLFVGDDGENRILEYRRR